MSVATAALQLSASMTFQPGSSSVIELTKSESLYCHACEKRFPYPSKLRRHLESRRHKMLAGMLELLNLAESPDAVSTTGTSSEEIPELNLTQDN